MTVELEKHMGRTVELYMKDGTAFVFKPMMHNIGKNTFKGLDQENLERSVRLEDIDSVIYFKNVDWRL